MTESVTINGVEFAPVSSKPTGNRAIVVADKGWIFVGQIDDQTELGVVVITEASNIRTWGKGGFGGLSKSRVGSDAKLDPCADLRIRKSSVLFVVPVSEDW